jgi:signal transduction histidine kinase
VQAIDVRLVVQASARLARSALACRGLDVDARLPEGAVTVHVDAEQVQRALLNIMLVSASSLREGHIILTIDGRSEVARITIELDGATTLPAAGEIFEPFRTSGPGHGLALATAARLIENQRGAVRAAHVNGRLRYVIDLPVVTQESVAQTGSPADANRHRDVKGLSVGDPYTV